MLVSDPPKPGASESGARQYSLDALRGVAALSVVLLHLFSTIRDIEYDGFVYFNKILEFTDRTPIGALWAGNQAVYIFFIMSGFALTSMLDGFKYGYGSYTVRRLMRLWAPCVISIAASLLILHFTSPTDNPMLGTWYNHLIGEPIRLRDVVDHFLMIGEMDSTKINFVTWSLVHELRLSLVFPIILMATRKSIHWKTLFVSFSISIVTLYLRSNGYISDNKTSFSSSLIYQVFFVVGILMHDHRDRLSKISLCLSRTQYVAILLLSLTIYANPISSIYFSGLIGGSIIVALTITPGPFSDFLKHRTPLWLGRISYSLYLIHPIFLVNGYNALRQYDEMVIATILFIPINILVAAVFCEYIEIPLNRAGQRLSRIVDAHRDRFR